MKHFFEVSHHKASVKVSINSFMMGSLIFILTLVWTLSPSKFIIQMIAQIVLAIPLLFVSSLAYAKIGHKQKEEQGWDTFGWFTNNIGSIFILNVVGLMTGTIYKELALFYFLLTIILMGVYSSINVFYNKQVLKEKLFKFLFFVLVMFLGGILPIILYY